MRLVPLSRSRLWLVLEPIFVNSVPSMRASSDVHVVLSVATTSFAVPIFVYKDDTMGF